MDQRNRPVIHSFPTSDRQFAADAAAALDDAHGTETAEELRLSLTDALRSRYRNVLVVTQNDLARISEGQPGLYLYRDGRIRAGNAQRDRLYASMAAARRTTADSKAILGRSTTVAADAGFPDKPALPDKPSAPSAPRTRR